MMKWLGLGSLVLLAACKTTDPDIRELKKPGFTDVAPPALIVEANTKSLRFATYNTSLYNEEDGGLIKRLQNNDASARKIAAVIQHQRPDVLLLNEFDYYAVVSAVTLFKKIFLSVSQD